MDVQAPMTSQVILPVMCADPVWTRANSRYPLTQKKRYVWSLMRNQDRLQWTQGKARHVY